MSFDASAWAIRSIADSPTDKLVLIVLSDYADHRDIAFPTHATIAERAMCSPKTVGRALERLEERGLIEIISGKEHGKSNRYRVLWRVGQNDRPPSDRVGQNDRGVGHSYVLGVGHANRCSPVKVRPEPSNKSLINQYPTRGDKKSPENPSARPLLDTTNPDPDDPRLVLADYKKTLDRLPADAPSRSYYESKIQELEQFVREAS